MSTIDRYIRDDGKVGVLLSPGYGAGWSTWDRQNSEFLCLDKQLITMILEEDYTGAAKRVQDVTKSETVEEDDLRCLVVDYVPQGVLFRINEYDGHETVELFHVSSFFKA